MFFYNSSFEEIIVNDSTKKINFHLQVPILMFDPIGGKYCSFIT